MRDSWKQRWGRTLCMLVAGAWGLQAGGEEIPFFAVLEGEQETPPIETEADGLTFGELDVDEGAFSLRVTHTVANFTVSHIHEEVPGTAGPIVFDLGDTTSPIERTWTDMTAEEVRKLRAGVYYVNVHSQEHPPGEVRGQLLPETAILLFENSGPEQGVTAPGTSDFYFAGTTWSGGVVGSLGVPNMYASGSYHYQMPDGAEADFFHPVEAVSFFFVHGSTMPVGEARAYTEDGELVETASSHEATTFNDADNFVHWEFSEPVSRVEFTGASLDDFSYVFAAPEENGEEPPVTRADINGDGHVNAVDIQLVVNAALGLPIDFDADVNEDGQVSAVDVQLVVNAALGLPIPF